MSARITNLRFRNFRSLVYVDLELGPFQVIVGPNGSGKSSVFQALKFLSVFLDRGLEAAIEAIGARDLRSLISGGQNSSIGLAIDLQLDFSIPGFGSRLTYEVFWNFADARRTIPRVSGESIRPIVLGADGEADLQCRLPVQMKRSADGGVREVFDAPFLSLEDGAPDFANIPINQTAARYTPPSQALRLACQAAIQELTQGVHIISLNPRRLAEPCPDAAGEALSADGWNLPVVVNSLRSTDRKRFNLWESQMKLSLPGLKSIGTELTSRGDARYMMLRFENGAEVPAWGASEGTLRFLALTILPNLPGLRGIYCIDEPENGLHPQLIEDLDDTFRSYRDAQVIVATHSQDLVSLLRPDELIVATLSDKGETHFTRGSNHPLLKNWDESQLLGPIFTSGALVSDLWAN